MWGRARLRLLYDYFRTCFPKRSIQMLDTDRQGHPLNCLVLLLTNVISVMFLSAIGLMVLVLLRWTVSCAACAQMQSLTIVDTGAGWPGNVWQIAMMCECIIIPTSLSGLIYGQLLNLCARWMSGKKAVGLLPPPYHCAKSYSSGTARSVSYFPNS